LVPLAIELLSFTAGCLALIGIGAIELYLLSSGLFRAAIAFPASVLATGYLLHRITWRQRSDETGRVRLRASGHPEEPWQLSYREPTREIQLQVYPETALGTKVLLWYRRDLHWQTAQGEQPLPAAEQALILEEIRRILSRRHYQFEITE
jgi:hypothetical protein